MRLLILAVLLVTGVQLAASAATQCYACSVAGCGDPFNANATGVIKVPAVNGWCMKVKGEANGKTAVVRLSDVGVCSSNKCEKQTEQGITGIGCCCNSDLCNAGPRSISTITVSFVASLVALCFVARFF